MLLVGAGLLVAVFAAIGQATADPFYYPPEQNWSGTWQTPFPYQRNVLWNFNQNPVGGPSPSGTPGAIYEGTLDPTLKASDVVAMSGFQWYSTYSFSIADTYTDCIVIDNTNGTSPITGSLSITLDNTTLPNGVKHMWVETYGVTSNGSAAVETTDTITSTPLGTVTGPFAGQSSLVGLNPPLFVDAQGYTITPNPYEETYTINEYVPSGDWVVYTSVHIATECVPEPTTFTLLGIGAISLLAYAWRKRQRTV